MNLLFALLMLATNLVSGTRALADSFPYDSICRQHAGTSETVQLQSSSRKVVLCVFGINAYVDRESVQKSEMQFWTQAVFQYKHNDDFAMTEHCTQLGARIEKAVSSTGRQFQLCSFNDSSYMEEETFSRGPENFTNREMNQALGLIFSN